MLSANWCAPGLSVFIETYSLWKSDTFPCCCRSGQSQISLCLLAPSAACFYITLSDTETEGSSILPKMWVNKIMFGALAMCSHSSPGIILGASLESGCPCVTQGKELLAQGHTTSKRCCWDSVPAPTGLNYLLWTTTWSSLLGCSSPCGLWHMDPANWKLPSQRWCAVLSVLGIFL